MISEPLPQRVLVAIPDRTIVWCTRVGKDCPLEVVGLVLKVYLIVLHLTKFDIILGMHWLFQHYAKINCRKREVVFKPPIANKICYEGEPIKTAPLVVTTCQSKKCIREGATAYLLVAIDKAEEPIGIQGIPIIEDLPKVFADDLPGLPPNRKTKFVIDLEPATASEHRAPYRMPLQN